MRKATIPVIPARIFDLENYTSNYKGYGLIGRLGFIIDKSEELKVDATHLLLQHLKQTSNTRMYKNIFRAAKVRGHQIGELDSEWIAKTDAKALEQQHMKEEELKSVSLRRIKEAARFGHHDMGEFFYHRGDLERALKEYRCALEHCSDVRHYRNTCMYIIQTLLWMGIYSEVNDYVEKAKQKGKSTPEVLKLQLTCASGLAKLSKRNYKEAAGAFTSVSMELGRNFCEVLAPCDVVIYGSLCALASFSHQELSELITTNKHFKDCLESLPIMRELLWFFHGKKFQICFAILAELRKEILLDVFMSQHFDDIVKTIQQNAIVLYCEPFLSIRIPKMAAEFGVEANYLEQELANLIQSGKLKAKIDKVNCDLCSLEKVGEFSPAIYEDVLEMGREYNLNASASLLHAQLTKEGLGVK